MRLSDFIYPALVSIGLHAWLLSSNMLHGDAKTAFKKGSVSDVRLKIVMSIIANRRTGNIPDVIRANEHIRNPVIKPAVKRTNVKDEILKEPYKIQRQVPIQPKEKKDVDNPVSGQESPLPRSHDGMTATEIRQEEDIQSPVRKARAAPHHPVEGDDREEADGRTKQEAQRQKIFTLNPMHRETKPGNISIPQLFHRLKDIRVPTIILQ